MCVYEKFMIILALIAEEVRHAWCNYGKIILNDMMARDQLHHIAPPYCFVLCRLWFDCIDVFTAKPKGWRYVGFEGMTTTAVKLSSSHLLNLV